MLGHLYVPYVFQVDDGGASKVMMMMVEVEEWRCVVLFSAPNRALHTCELCNEPNWMVIWQNSPRMKMNINPPPVLPMWWDYDSLVNLLTSHEPVTQQ